VNKQVLLVSGGGHLDPFKAVSCYCAGTDTSPFFLFSKNLIDHPEPPSAYFDTRPGKLLYLSQKYLLHKNYLLIFIYTKRI